MRRLAIVLFALSCSAFTPNFALAAVFLVGSGDGCTHTNLDSAISAAAASPGLDRILLSRTMEYRNISSELVNQEVEIIGGLFDCLGTLPAGETTLDGAGGPHQSVLRIRGNSTVTLSRLRIQNGDATAQASGGAIDFKASGSLTLDYVRLTQNSAGQGGGIAFRGEGRGAVLTLLDGNVIDFNTATHNGGGIALSGRATMKMAGTATKIFSNHALGPTPAPGHAPLNGYGGGIFIESPASADIGAAADNDGTVLFDNVARNGGGIAVLGNDSGHANRVRLYSAHAQFPLRIRGNQAHEKGGAVYARATSGSLGFSRPGVCLLDTSLVGNTAQYGAAVYIERASSTAGEDSPYFSINACPKPEHAATCPRGRSCSEIESNWQTTALAPMMHGSVIEVELSKPTNAAAVVLNGFVARSNSGRSLLRFHGSAANASRIQNALIYHNTLDQFVVEAPENATLVNQSTIASNPMNPGAQFLLQLHQPNASTAGLSKVTNSILYAGVAGTMSAIELSGAAQLFEVAHVFTDLNLSVTGATTRYLSREDPAFLDAARGDFRLLPNSPAIDYAPAYGDGLDTDVYGMGRIVDLPKRNISGARDVGAHEQTAAQLPNPSEIVRIEGSDADSKRRLIEALQAGGKHILLASNVDIDLSDQGTIGVARGTIVEGTRSGVDLGARLFTTQRPVPQLLINCTDEIRREDVKLRGFRLIGPHFHSASGDSNTERAIMVDSCSGVEISNMEIAGWSGQAIYIVDYFNKLNDNNAVHVHHNFLHHNQHVGDNGYGVVTRFGARALIEKNVFDFNRHAIAASGKNGPYGEDKDSPLNGTGYVALNNLVLVGGGYHGGVFGTDLDEYTHQFDVHGTDNCYPNPFGNTLTCGQAGHSFVMRSNAFQYVSDYAIKVRGDPTEAAIVEDNVFALDEDDAIKQNSYPVSAPGNPIRISGNKYDVATPGKLGVCDFDADGKDDLFMATGANWWYSSAGQSHWIFLKTANERLHQLGLGDFDGDKKCDVVAGGTPYPLQIAHGGTGDWKVLVDRSGVELVDPFDRLAFGDFNGDGRTDIFYRGNEGQWQIISPGTAGAPGAYDWTPIQSSSYPLSALRFGDFNNDGITDVIVNLEQGWSVSFGGQTSWQPLNAMLHDDLKSVLIGDIDHNGLDDIVRFRVFNLPDAKYEGIWEVSFDGRSKWTRVHSFLAQPEPGTGHVYPPSYKVSALGRFRGAEGGVELLAADWSDRIGKRFSTGGGRFEVYGRYAY
jgi:hypothetical protein